MQHLLDRVSNALADSFAPVRGLSAPPALCNPCIDERFYITGENIETLSPVSTGEVSEAHN